MIAFFGFSARSRAPPRPRRLGAQLVNAASAARTSFDFIRISHLLWEPGSGRTPRRAEQIWRRADRRPPQLLMPVLLLAIAGAMAAEPWAGTRSWPTVKATSSAAGDDGFAKSATQTLATLTVAIVLRGTTSVQPCAGTPRRFVAVKRCKNIIE